MEKLTNKQELFINYLLQGLSQREAYKKAYKAKYKDSAIDNMASKLFNTPKVYTRYTELMEKATKKAIMTAEERMEWLSKVITGDVKEVVMVKRLNIETGEEETIETEMPSQLSTKLKALDSLNKMTGEYTTKVEGDVSITKLEDLI